MEYKRILLGTDGSEAIEPVYEHCTYLARLTHATVDIVYILDMDGVQPELAVFEADTESRVRHTTSSLRVKKLSKMQSAPCFREASTKRQLRWLCWRGTRGMKSTHT